MHQMNLPTQKAMRYQPGCLILAGDECSAALVIDDDDNHGEYVHYHGWPAHDGRDDECYDQSLDGLLLLNGVGVECGDVGMINDWNWMDTGMQVMEWMNDASIKR